jgi:hypothetical protein
MPKEIAILAVVGLPTFLIALRLWLRHREKMASMQGTNSSISEERFARLEQTMDAMAVEIERIGEGQRFLTKVLASGDASQPVAARDAAPQSIGRQIR